jgi:thiol-disulfide isomerase/thioredoxin
VTGASILRRSARGPLPRPVRYVLLAIGLLVALFLVTRPLGSTPPPLEGDGFYAVGPVREGLAPGDRAPSLEAMVGGQLLTPEPLPGSGVVTLGEGTGTWLVFGATWCTPCREEAPAIEEAYRRHADGELTILSIKVQEHAEVVRSYAAAEGLGYPLAVDRTGALAQRFGVYGYPTHYFIGPDGIVRARHLGPLTSAQIEERLSSILP